MYECERVWWWWYGMYLMLLCFVSVLYCIVLSGCVIMCIKTFRFQPIFPYIFRSRIQIAHVNKNSCNKITTTSFGWCGSTTIQIVLQAHFIICKSMKWCHYFLHYIQIVHFISFFYCLWNSKHTSFTSTYFSLQFLILFYMFYVLFCLLVDKHFFLLVLFRFYFILFVCFSFFYPHVSINLSQHWKINFIYVWIVC